jgi:hypothetical protein
MGRHRIASSYRPLSEQPGSYTRGVETWTSVGEHRASDEYSSRYNQEVYCGPPRSLYCNVLTKTWNFHVPANFQEPGSFSLVRYSKDFLAMLYTLEVERVCTVEFRSVALGHTPPSTT